MRDQKPIHYIPYNKDNTPGFYTFTEAYKHWCRSTSFRAMTAWDHWYLLNMWLLEDIEEERKHPPCPDCSLPMTEDGECVACETGEWLFTAPDVIQSK